MVITDTLEERVPTLLAADTTTIAPAANACHVHLVTAEFVPGRGTRFGDLTIAAGAGLEEKSAGVGAQTMGYDPVRQAWKVVIKEPVGGWNWISTAVESPAETVYGYVVTDNADAATFGSELLPDGPVLVDDTGIIVSVGEIVIWVPIGVFTGQELTP